MNWILRSNLMSEKDYTPFCGSNKCAGLKRSKFNKNTSQFHCSCGWVSEFPKDFIDEYRAKWNL